MSLHGACALQLARPAAAVVAQGASKNQDSVADIVLAGHDDIAEFAVGLSSAAPLVASGGRDTNVSTYRGWSAGEEAWR